MYPLQVWLQPPSMWHLNLSATVEFLLYDFAKMTIMHGTNYVNFNSSVHSTSMAIVNIKFFSKRKSEIKSVGLET